VINGSSIVQREQAAFSFLALLSDQIGKPNQHDGICTWEGLRKGYGNRLSDGNSVAMLPLALPRYLDSEQADS